MRIGAATISGVRAQGYMAESLLAILNLFCEEVEWAFGRLLWLFKPRSVTLVMAEVRLLRDCKALSFPGFRMSQKLVMGRLS